MAATHWEDDTVIGPAVEDCVRSVPVEVHGLPDVLEVAVYGDRLEVRTPSGWTGFGFEQIARQQGSAANWWPRRLVGRARLPLAVGEREFCTERRYVAFYTSPPLTIYTPPDHQLPYVGTYICRINTVLGKAGYFTHDMS